MAQKTIFVVPGEEPAGARACSPAFAQEARRAYADLAAWVQIEDNAAFAATANVTLEDAAAARQRLRDELAAFGPTPQRTKVVKIEVA